MERLIHRMAKGLQKTAEILCEKSMQELAAKHAVMDGKFVPIQTVQMQMNGERSGEINFHNLEGGRASISGRRI
jgi:hypothetical protein